MQNPLSQLALNAWYKVLIALGGAVFLLTGAGAFPAFPTAATGAISLGCVFIGIGEWINHPLKTAIYQEDAFRERVFTIRWRSNKPIGIAFDVLGATLTAIGIYKFF
ncbi:hypothetical protein [Pantoea rodasii]|uniref:hypothetical protein n=1 Tax=Pantoea rodasii TaxID=1076549 RepID=UPI000FFBAB73|nr:hypothetical protein [Pantoea rodasii]